MPEIQEQQAAPADTKPKNFAEALDQAFKADDAKAIDPDNKDDGAAVVKKEEKAKVEKAPEQKSATPRDLFKKPEAKQAETTTSSETAKSAFDEIAAPEFKDEKGKKGWEALKTEAKSWESKAKQLEREAAERKAAGRDAETLESKYAEAQKTLKEYDEIVSRARLDDHPAFRKEFVEGRQKVVDRAKAIIEESDGDPKAIETALNLKGKARADALREASSNLDAFQAARLGRAIDELSDLDERAQAKRDAAKKSYDELKEQERQRGIEESATKSKRRAVETEEVIRRLVPQLEVLQEVQGNDEWNSKWKRVIQETRDHVKDHPESDPEAELLSRAFALQRDLFLDSDEKLQAVEKKAAALEAELKAIHSKSPSLAARAAATAGGKSETNRPFSQAFSEKVGA